MVEAFDRILALLNRLTSEVLAQTDDEELRRLKEALVAVDGR